MPTTYPFAIPSGVNIYPVASGNTLLGTSSKPFSTGYFNTVIVSNNSFARWRYNEVPVGNINGSNRVFTLSNTPIGYNIQVFNSGFYQIPSGVGGLVNHYVLSGYTITFNTAPGSGVGLIANYGY